MHFVIIPGIDNSDDQHWQSIWQAEWGKDAARISPASWTSPDLSDWCSAIERAVLTQPPSDVVLVAHSLGALAAAQWISRAQPELRGAFLVAPPDRAGPSFPASAAPTFAAMPGTGPLGLPGLIVAGDNDPYCGRDVTDRLASEWEVSRVDAGMVGHINSASGIGRWEFGRALLTAFVAGTRQPRSG